MVDRDPIDAQGIAQPTIGMSLIRLLTVGALLFVVVSVLGSVIDPARPRQVSGLALVVQLMLCVVAIFAYRLVVRAVERRDASELPWIPDVRLTLAGILLGAALFCAVYGILWLAGMARFAGVRGLDGVPLVLVISIAAGVGEEIFFRGVIYRIVENTFGTVVALAVSSLLFGFAHAANPAATVFSSTAIALEAGLLLGLAYSATRSLWFPIGIHFAWNFTQTGIFGAPLSGFKLDGLLQVPLSGPEWLTGGAFGPEASVITLTLCLVVAAALGWATMRAGQWRPLGRSTRRAEP